MKKPKVLCNVKGCKHFSMHLTDSNIGWVCNEYQPLPMEKRPLTEYEKLKLSWYKSEKKWVEHIQGRQIVMDKGVKKVLYQGREIPQQPRKYWSAKPK